MCGNHLLGGQVENTASKSVSTEHQAEIPGYRLDLTFCTFFAGSPGVALIACDVDGNGNLTMTKSVIEDAGWHGGAGFLFAQEATGKRTKSQTTLEWKKFRC